MIVRMGSGEPGFALKSDGSKVPLEPGKGYSLGVGTYYIDASAPDSRVREVHLKWDSTLVATSINYETCGFPAFIGADEATADVALNDANTGANLGNWITQNPSSGVYIPTGTGFTVTNMTIAVSGGTANGTSIDLGNCSSRRARIKIVVTTAGFLRVGLCAE